MLNYLLNDIVLLIMDTLSLNNVINIRVTNKENKEIAKLYTPKYLVCIKKKYKINIKYISKY